MAKVKRQRLDTSEDECKVSIDRISVLADEVLGLILSFLTFKEAIATSILSRRWKDLWILTPKLDLDGLWILTPRLNLHGRQLSYKVKETERYEYFKWVDGVIALHQRSSLEEFRVSFDLSQSDRERIDEWLSYALSRKVQRLDLNLVDLRRDRTVNYHLCYTFPYKEGNFPNNLKLLKTLSMHSVNVSGEALGFFLGNCPLLERVSVSASQVLLSLEIIRPFPSFKCLEISSCYNLKSVVLRDSNVATIKYHGKRIQFLLVNVPLLTQLWIRAPSTEHMKDVVRMFSSVFPQLEIFKIYSTSVLSLKECRKFVSAVEMCNLKQLAVSLGEGYSNHRNSLLPVINLIRISPCLQRFVLEAAYSNQRNFFGACATREILKKIPRAYFHLKEVEFVGYRGDFNQFQMIMHFVDNDVALENIIVDPRCFKVPTHRLWDCVPRHKIQDDISAMAIEQFKKYIPSRINVKFL